MRITHVINPFRAPEGSKAARVQGVTFEALRRAVGCARAFAPGISVEVLAAVFPEDRAWAAGREPVTATADLSRSLLDVTAIRPAKRLPLIGDILRAGCEWDGGGGREEGAYVIYTNMDICPQPYFYEAVARLIEERPGGFSITRRNVEERAAEAKDLALMAADGGERSYGLDTFVFPRGAGKGFDLAHVAVGLPWIDEAVMGNIDAACGFQGEVFKRLHATFHLGNDLDWKRDEALCEFNRLEAVVCFRSLVERHPEFPAGSHFDRMQAKVLERAARCKTALGRVRGALGLDRRGR